MNISKGLRAMLKSKYGLAWDATDDEARTLLFAKMASGEITTKDLVDAEKSTPDHQKKHPAEFVGEIVDEKLAALGGKGTGPTSRQMFGGGPNVKRMRDVYSTTKATMLHPVTGAPATDQNGRELRHASQHENAMIGAIMKARAIKSGLISAGLRENEKMLIEDAFEGEWVGEDGPAVKVFSGSEAKALYNDNTSGGSAVVPLWFDQNLTTLPRWYGALFPRVTVIDMPRSATVQSATVGHAAWKWENTPDGSGSNTLFTTDGFLSQLSSSVYNANFSAEISRDWIADADVADVGSHLTQQAQQGYAVELDRIIAVGDGATQPQGLTNASGITTVQSVYTLNGYQASLSDLSNLAFALPLQYRQGAFAPAWIMSDSTWARISNLTVGSDDQRRLIGMDLGAYRLFQWPVLIQPDIPFRTIYFGCLKFYKIWRRLGLQIEMTNEGKTLRLANMLLITMRSRLAGKLTTGEAMVEMTAFGPPN